jgi:hypothetical protein
MNKQIIIRVGIGLLFVAVLVAGYLLWGRSDAQAPASESRGADGGGRRGPDGAGKPLPVMAAAARSGDIDVVINEIGRASCRERVYMPV